MSIIEKLQRLNKLRGSAIPPSLHRHVSMSIRK